MFSNQPLLHFKSSSFDQSSLFPLNSLPAPKPLAIFDFAKRQLLSCRGKLCLRETLAPKNAHGDDGERMESAAMGETPRKEGAPSCLFHRRSRSEPPPTTERDDHHRHHDDHHQHQHQRHDAKTSSSGPPRVPVVRLLVALPRPSPRRGQGHSRGPARRKRHGGLRRDHGDVQVRDAPRAVARKPLQPFADSLSLSLSLSTGRSAGPTRGPTTGTPSSSAPGSTRTRGTGTWGAMTLATGRRREPPTSRRAGSTSFPGTATRASSPSSTSVARGCSSTSGAPGTSPSGASSYRGARDGGRRGTPPRRWTGAASASPAAPRTSTSRAWSSGGAPPLAAGAPFSSRTAWFSCGAASSWTALPGREARRTSRGPT